MGECDVGAGPGAGQYGVGECGVGAEVGGCGVGTGME